MRTAFLTLCMWVFGCVCARAQERVILRERSGLRPGLCAALRIQLSDLAEVECEPDDETELVARLVRASARVGERDARIGVLIERDPDPAQVRMYIVTSQRDQAVIAIERSEDRSDPDVDRSLALKVRGAYELVGVVRAAAPAASPGSAVETVGLLAVPAPPRPAAPAPAVVAAPPLHLVMDAGGGVAVDQHTRLAAQFVLGLAWQKEKLRVESGLGVRLLSRSEESREHGHVSVVERGPVLSLRALTTRGRFALGAALDASLLVISAQGIAPDGSRGDERELTPSLALALDARVRLVANAFLRFAPALELLTVQRSFSVDQRVVYEDGRVRGLFPLSLVVSLPLVRDPEGTTP